ncbi:hypothetical protein ACE1CI_10305 [Aerosakkonemataceae cyanobacterium BLCC-F50]|uniref:Uncharacterized protein n=1 Tax=Floridaenema flaviceps BLCC-F50 TaxID=3153642 RepID=A0ABV4XNL4_9CYAN
MNHADAKIIDPSELSIPETAVIQKVLSDQEQLPTDQHDKAVRAFLISDGIASGIGKDLAFVDKIPGFIKEIIDNKLWECLYVAKGVVTPYYCRYTKGTDSENFRAFITAKRPNGLETSVETIDRVLQADPEVQRKFRAIIYQAQEKERDETGKYITNPSRLEGGMAEELGNRHQERLRAANRAAEAIPAIGELLDRGLIAIEIAALLGRDIKDPNNLAAEEREYVDKRDLIGLRINQYIYTNPIPDDEDKEPAYSRELNRHVKDLLGIKDRSKPIRMDNPKKAAEKLLQFYQGDKLKELIDHLRSGLELPTEIPEPTLELASRNGQSTDSNQLVNPTASRASTIEQSTTTADKSIPSPNLDLPALKPAEDVVEKTVLENRELTLEELAKRLKRSLSSIRRETYKDQDPAGFTNWTRKRDPEGIGWQRSDKKRGRSVIYIPAPEPNQE